MKVRHIVIAAAATLFAADPAGANVLLYTNGPAESGDGAYKISGTFPADFFFFEVADSFTASAGSRVETIDFLTLDQNGFTPETVIWTITSGNPFSGDGFTVLGSGTASITATNLGAAGTGYTLWSDTIAISPVTLTGGNYWLEFSDAVDGGGSTFDTGEYWDTNNGPSVAWGNGFLGGEELSGSQDFSLYGMATPEPSIWALMLTGFAGLGAMVRTRRSRRAGSILA